MPRDPSRPSLLRLLSIVVAVVLGLGIVGTKLSSFSRPQTFVQPAFAQKAPSAAALVPSSSAIKPAVSADPSASAPPPSASTVEPAASAQSASPKPLDYAVIQSAEDFPADMSDEERRAMGDGKVPIHREGRYRSPLAHPRFGEPTVARVGLVLRDIRNYDIQTGEFSASFYLSLTGNKELPDLDLDFANASEAELSPLVQAPTFHLYEVSGTFLAPVDLRKYPFDEQRLSIELEDRRAGVDQIVFEADINRTSLDEGFMVSGWNVARLVARAYKHLYPPRFDRDDLYISRYKFELVIARFGLSAVLSVFVPAVMIVLISLTGLFVPPAELEVRSNTGAPMLAAAVLFHYALIQELPATGYMTRADWIMMATYMCLLMNMISTWLFVVVPESKIEATFKTARWLVPLLSTVVMVTAFLV